MSNERALRIASFKRISGFFLWISTPALILTCVAGVVGLIGILLVDTGSVDLHQCLLTKKCVLNIFDNASEVGIVREPSPTVAVKAFFSIVLLCVLVPAIYILAHIQSLIKCFHNGDIFNVRALTHARKAYRVYLYTGTIFILIHFSLIIYYLMNVDQGNSARFFDWISDVIVFCIEIGFLSLLLWALEIGTDLNEEAELTI